MSWSITYYILAFEYPVFEISHCLRIICLLIYQLYFFLYNNDDRSPLSTTITVFLCVLLADESTVIGNELSV